MPAIVNPRDVILIAVITVIALAFAQPLFDRIDGATETDAE